MMTSATMMAVVILLIIVMIAVVAWARKRGETFRPHRVNTCTNAQDVLPAAMADPDYSLHQWTGENNENWTTEVTPWDPDSRIQLESAALTPGARRMYLPVNPLTRVGITSKVRNWENPYAGNDIMSDPCSNAVSAYERQPFQPGFMIPKKNDSTDETPDEGRFYYQPEYWSRASGPYGGPYNPLASCDAEPRCVECPMSPCMEGGSAALAEANAFRIAEGMTGGPQKGIFEGLAGPEQTGRYTSDLASLVDISVGPGYVQPPRGESSLPMLGGAGLETMCGAPHQENLYGSAFWWQAPGGIRAPGGEIEHARKPDGSTQENLRSNPSLNNRSTGRADDCLTGVGCGLGTTWIDPRFEPGPQAMYYGGSNIWAHGGHAGGPTFGAFAPFVFQRGGAWDRYVDGYGDGNYVAPTQ